MLARMVISIILSTCWIFVTYSKLSYSTFREIKTNKHLHDRISVECSISMWRNMFCRWTFLFPHTTVSVLLCSLNYGRCELLLRGLKSGLFGLLPSTFSVELKASGEPSTWFPLENSYNFSRLINFELIREVRAVYSSSLFLTTFWILLHTRSYTVLL